MFKNRGLTVQMMNYRIVLLMNIVNEHSTANILAKGNEPEVIKPLDPAVNLKSQPIILILVGNTNTAPTAF